MRKPHSKRNAPKTKRVRMISPEKAIHGDRLWVTSFGTKGDNGNLVPRYQARTFLQACQCEMRGLTGELQTCWRIGAGDLKALGSKVVDLTLLASSVCQRFDLTPNGEAIGFNFGMACEWGYLIRGEFIPELVKWLPTLVKREQWTTYPYELAEAGLVLAMIQRSKIQGWDEFLTSVFRQRLKVSELANTFDLYTQMIHHAVRGDIGSMSQLINEADTNYERRSSDEEYRNFDTYHGGSMYNAVRIDYRLATIIKWAFADNPGEQRKLSTIHKWPTE